MVEAVVVVVVVGDVVVVEVEVELGLEVVVVVDGGWVVLDGGPVVVVDRGPVVVVVAGATAGGGTGKLQSADAQSPGVVAWTNSVPGCVDTDSTGSGGPDCRQANAGSVVPMPDRFPTTCTVPTGSGGAIGVSRRLVVPA